VSFNGTLDITPVLKPLPVAEFIAQDTTSDLVVGVSGGIKTLSTDSQYITWFRQKSGNDKSFERTNLNQSPLPGISSVQYPDKQNFALVLRGSEVGVLDFATPDTSSQDYTIFSSENIGPIALSHSGIEVFYWQYNPELDKSFLVRNNPTGTKPDRYFDQALIDQLDINKPVISWSKDDKYVLMVDEHIVLVSLVERTAKIIRYEKGISKAQLTPNNQTIIATSKSGELLTVNLLSEEDTPTPEVHDIRVLNDNFQTMDDETIYFLNDEKQLIEYNFARKEKIVYLIDSQLTIDDDATIAIDSANQLVYFWSKGEIFKQALVSEQYE
ncbi:hypothetical protein KBB60_01925, partial [Patescibacteria group bacterium]|nr:hypothetical protein [Patescibacteria group bacterium]